MQAWVLESLKVGDPVIVESRDGTDWYGTVIEVKDGLIRVQHMFVTGTYRQSDGLPPTGGGWPRLSRRMEG